MGDHQTGGGKILTDLTQAQMEAEAARLLFTRPITFLMGAVSLDTLPPYSLPEVAFVGRSNVGKSSLINALVGRSGVARASNTPGRTQEINFFDLDGRLTLVDLPGYGFAQAPKDKVEKWTRLIRGYLKGRPVLRRVLLLIDSRHGVKDNDKTMMDMLDKAAVVYQVVLTKADKIKGSELEDVRAKTQEQIARRVAAFPFMVSTSSEKGLGLDELRHYVWQLAEQNISQ
jgi:GTP-binding protein